MVERTLDDLAGSRVLVLGLGVSGLSAAKFCRHHGADVLVVDDGPELELTEPLAKLEELGIPFRSGGEPDTLVARRDLLVISPGVALSARHPLVEAAFHRGIDVISEIELATVGCPCPIIAITGTNGKSTTTTLVGRMLAATGTRAHVVGNIGVPFAERTLIMRPDDVAVLEVSAGQLECTHTLSPKISVLLNIQSDHANLYPDADYYLRLKQRVQQRQGPEQHCVISADDDGCQRVAPFIRARLHEFSRAGEVERGAFVRNGEIVVRGEGGLEPIVPVSEVPLGSLDCALAACIVADLEGVPPSIVQGAVRGFSGLKHRIQVAAHHAGITYYNDSKATNPAATRHAVRSIPGPVVLIAGGKDDKCVAADDFVELFGISNLRAVITMGETSQMIREAGQRVGYRPIWRVRSIVEALIRAAALARPGDAVLLSPGANSRDTYSNHEERGAIFCHLSRWLPEIQSFVSETHQSSRSMAVRR